MWDIIERFFALFAIIVVLTIFSRHGSLDFTYVDKARDTIAEAVKSDEGQSYINETKDVSKDVFSDLFHGLKRFIFGKDKQAEETDLVKAELTYVVDGDTIYVKIGDEEKKVRFIGIDTPESVNQAEPERNNEYGRLASQYTKVLLKDVKYVYLEYDQEPKDRYDRDLAYIWLTDKAEDMEDNMLNAILLKDGYAFTLEMEPNTKYKDAFRILKKNADENNIGLWEFDDFRRLER